MQWEAPPLPSLRLRTVFAFSVLEAAQGHSFTIEGDETRLGSCLNSVKIYIQTLKILTGGHEKLLVIWVTQDQPCE